ncbi:MAG: hypothetical protein KBS76_08190 [Ruminococcus sp.]|nr:hypothetical protein [Candidatus Apopatosoma intestinale]
MRIFVKTEEKRRIVLWVPTFLVFNHLTALLIPSALRKVAEKVAEKTNCPDFRISVSDAAKMVSACYRMRLRHPAMPFVEVKVREKDGERVSVRI